MGKIMVFGSLIGLGVFLSITSVYGLSLFEKEKEIKDEFIEKLFAPETQYKSVRVIEKDGERRVVIDFGKKITKEMEKQYSYTLTRRGITIYSVARHAPSPLYYKFMLLMGYAPYGMYEMYLIREVEGEEDVVEVSKNEIYPPGTEDLWDAFEVKRKRIEVKITPEFGHKWERKRIFQGKDAPVGTLI